MTTTMMMCFGNTLDKIALAAPRPWYDDHWLSQHPWPLTLARPLTLAESLRNNVEHVAIKRSSLAAPIDRFGFWYISGRHAFAFFRPCEFCTIYRRQFGKRSTLRLWQPACLAVWLRSSVCFAIYTYTYECATKHEIRPLLFIKENHDSVTCLASRSWTICLAPRPCIFALWRHCCDLSFNLLKAKPDKQQYVCQSSSRVGFGDTLDPLTLAAPFNSYVYVLIALGSFTLLLFHIAVGCGNHLANFVLATTLAIIVLQTPNPAAHSCWGLGFFRMFAWGGQAWVPCPGITCPFPSSFSTFVTSLA